MGGAPRRRPEALGPDGGRQAAVGSHGELHQQSSGEGSSPAMPTVHLSTRSFFLSYLFIQSSDHVLPDKFRPGTTIRLKTFVVLH